MTLNVKTHAGHGTMAVDYTRGPIFGPLVRFSIPFMLSNALQVLYSMVDMCVVRLVPGLALMRGTNGFINGIGNARLALVFGLLDGVVLRIGCSWLLGSALGMGLAGYVLGYAIACYGMGVPSLIYFLWGGWEKRGAVTA